MSPARTENSIREACSDVRQWQRARWGLSAIRDGLDLVEAGRAEAGIQLARHGLEFLQDLTGDDK